MEHTLPCSADRPAMVRFTSRSWAARLTRLGVHFAVAPLHSYAAFFPSANLLALDPTALAESIEALASIIVHESNHALLASRRLLHPLLEERTERLAGLDQRIFGLALVRAGKVAEARRVLDIYLGWVRSDYGCAPVSQVQRLVSQGCTKA
jgi:hypothetical protein